MSWGLWQTFEVDQNWAANSSMDSRKCNAQYEFSHATEITKSTNGETLLYATENGLYEVLLGKDLIVVKIGTHLKGMVVNKVKPVSTINTNESKYLVAMTFDLLLYDIKKQVVIWRIKFGTRILQTHIIDED